MDPTMTAQKELWNELTEAVKTYEEQNKKKLSSFMQEITKKRLNCLANGLHVFRFKVTVTLNMTV